MCVCACIYFLPLYLLSNLIIMQSAKNCTHFRKEYFTCTPYGIHFRRKRGSQVGIQLRSFYRRERCESLKCLSVGILLGSVRDQSWEFYGSWVRQKMGELLGKEQAFYREGTGRWASDACALYFGNRCHLCGPRAQLGASAPISLSPFGTYGEISLLSHG